MKIIEQKLFSELAVDIEDNGEIMKISDFSDDYFHIDKQGAKQLIEVLKEFVDEKV